MRKPVHVWSGFPEKNTRDFFFSWIADPRPIPMPDTSNEDDNFNTSYKGKEFSVTATRPVIKMHLHLSNNPREGHWCTTAYFSASRFHVILCSGALCKAVRLRAVHSLMMSSHCYFCLSSFWHCAVHERFCKTWASGDVPILFSFVLWQ